MNDHKFYIMQMEDAKDLPLPKYMSEQAAGMDLYANIHEATMVAPGAIQLIPTGIGISMPDGYEAQIRPRSGLALKHGVTMLNAPGTIDSDYRGEIKVILINLGSETFEVHRGMRIAQMVFNRIERIHLEKVEKLEDTQRGESGFGHTGVFF